jgi:hypothetical protein
MEYQKWFWVGFSIGMFVVYITADEPHVICSETKNNCAEGGHCNMV